MLSYLKNEVVLVLYPFSDLTSAKVRPAVIVNVPHVSVDSILVPLTSQTTSLLAGEFVLSDWTAAGLHLPTAVKRGIYTMHSRLIVKQLGHLSSRDAQQVDLSLRSWLGL
jgi:mRNA interferase MazF